METARHTGTQASLSALLIGIQHQHAHQWRWTMQMRAKLSAVLIGFVFLWLQLQDKRFGRGLRYGNVNSGKTSIYSQIWAHFYMRSWSDFCTLFFSFLLFCFVSFFLVITEIIRYSPKYTYIWMAKVYHISECFIVRSLLFQDREKYFCHFFITLYRLETKRINCLIFMYMYIFTL